MKKINIILFLILWASVGLGQQIFFKKYQVENGLSHNTVSCTMQDSYGFIWMGTNDGLNCFDGYDFKVYKKIYRDSTSLGNNQVQSLCEDKNKNIWVGTSKGIYIFDYVLGTFRFFNSKTEFGILISSNVNKIIQSKTGEIWIATLGQGFFIYNPEKQTLIQNSKYAAFVWDICEDKFGNFFVSSREEGLLFFDRTGRYINKEDNFLHFENKGNVRVNCIKNIDYNIWFGIGVQCLGCLDTKTKKCIYFSNKDIGTILVISPYSDRKLLIGTDKGLFWFDVLNNTFEKTDNYYDARSLSDYSINDILQDEEGGFWISTYLGGVNYFPKLTKKIEYYPPIYSREGEEGKIVNAFSEDKEHNIWIGCQDGLCIQDNKNLKINRIYSAKWNIQALLMDDENLWIGTLGEGLKIYNTKTKQITEHQHHRDLQGSICSNDVQCMYKDKNNTIYIGTSWGICRYNKDKNNFTTLNFAGSITAISDIVEDSKKTLWIATLNSGIYRYGLDNQHWTHFSYDETKENSLGNTPVIALFEDSNDILWLGTDGGGLYSYTDENGFINIDPEDKILPNKVIYSIEEDNSGNLWMSTNSGIIRINPLNVNDYKIFDKGDGLQSNQFNSRASFKTMHGKLFFGGIDGFNAFYPDEFKDNMYIPPVYVTDVYSHNDKTNETYLERTGENLFRKGKLILPYNHNNLTFRFSALSYEDSKKNQYKYQLDGFEKAWVKNNKHVVSYTNLSPGKYIFHLKASNNDGKWNDEGINVEIIITPPWWKTNFAYISYLLFITAILISSSRYFRYKTNLRIKQQVEQYNTEREKEIYQSKINFFVNLVHEIRTPLSLIKLPLEKVMEINRNTQSSKYLSIINKNIDYLLNVVNQLLDFQKSESKKIEVNRSSHNIILLIQTVYNQFEGVMELNSVEFKLELPNEEKEYEVDADILTKILVNLLSNALKFAKSFICIRLEYSTNSFKILIEDDGIGIEEKNKTKIFEAFYQAEAGKSKGVGIGLAFSTQLAEALNGRLSVENNSLGGASFILEINAVNSSESKHNINDIVIQDEIYCSSEFSNCRVLVVEDNKELLLLISEMLSDSFMVLKARNGKEALEKLLYETIDLIVSDVMMPEMDGFELTRRIKSDVNISHIPVILLTAKVSVDAKIEGMQQGADAYIEKPFSINYLKMQIENLLKLRLAFQEMMTKLPLYNTTLPTLSNRDHEFLTKLKIEVDEHLSDSTFSIDSIAEAMYMSRSNFYRKLKSITGIPPNDYLKTIRLNKSAELILKEDTRIGDVYIQVGFSSSSYFAKCFKAQFGVNPKDYPDYYKSTIKAQESDLNA